MQKYNKKQIQVEQKNWCFKRQTSKLLHQLAQRTILAFLQRLVASLADAQAAEHTTMPDLPVELVACLAGKWTPHVLRHGHIPMLLEAGEVNLVQGCRDGLDIRHGGH
jgi:hypothetical protein